MNSHSNDFLFLSRGEGDFHTDTHTHFLDAKACVFGECQKLALRPLVGAIFSRTRGQRVPRVSKSHGTFSAILFVLTIVATYPFTRIIRAHATSFPEC